MYMQLGAAVRKSEHQGFMKAKERWDNTSLGAKDFKKRLSKI
jgi:hypothetical protein